MIKRIVFFLIICASIRLGYLMGAGRMAAEFEQKFHAIKNEVDAGCITQPDPEPEPVSQPVKPKVRKISRIIWTEAS